MVIISFRISVVVMIYEARSLDGTRSASDVGFELENGALALFRSACLLFYSTSSLHRYSLMDLSKFNGQSCN